MGFNGAVALPTDAPAPDADPEDSLPRMTLTEHLDELRRRLVRAALALVLGMVVAFVFYKHVFAFATEPYVEALREAGGDGRLQSLAPLDTFVEVMKLAFLVGFIVTSPYVLAQMWGFIAAGLYDHERRVVRIFFPVSIGLFALGCATAYLMIFPVGLRFLIGFSKGLGVSTGFGVDRYLSMCLSVVFGLGLAFELPLVMLFLQATGIVETGTFRRGWRLAILSAFVIAMVLTPDPTPVSQCLMALPLVALYFLGVYGGRFVGTGRRAFRVLDAWPLVLTVGTLVTLFVFRRDLTSFAARLFE